MRHDGKTARLTRRYRRRSSPQTCRRSSRHIFGRASVHRGLSCSDANSAVFGAVGSPDWRGGQENQSPSSSLRERGGERVMLRMRCDIVTLQARVVLNTPAKRGGELGASTGFFIRRRRRVRVKRECYHTSNIPHQFPLFTLPLLLSSPSRSRRIRQPW